MHNPSVIKPYTWLKQADIECRLQTAKEDFLHNDEHLLIVGSSERSMVFRYAVYLDRLFPEWDVDCEYDRNLNLPKVMEALAPRQVVVPDIIVHQRNSKTNNLIAIEAKPDDNYKIKDWQRDMQKLAGFQRDPDFRYRFSVFLVFFQKECPVSVEYFISRDNFPPPQHTPSNEDMQVDRTIDVALKGVGG